LDTEVTASYSQAGIQALLTMNPADFGVFGVFTCISPKTLMHIRNAAGCRKVDVLALLAWTAGWQGDG
jgi:hypothetical protein